jgi:predicted HTH domain antitoxin
MEKEMSYATFADREIAALMRLGLYQSREEVISDAVRNLLLNNRSLRLELALDLFKNDEVSLGRAAEIAGLDRWQFEEILSERGIPIVIESDSTEAMDKELNFFFSQPA